VRPDASLTLKMGIAEVFAVLLSVDVSFGSGPRLDWIAKHSYKKGVQAHKYQFWKMIDLAPTRT
jgi:hypothetical protein